MKISIIISAMITTIALVSCKEKTKAPLPSVEEITEKAQEQSLNPKFEMIWQTDSVFKTPESCLVDKARNRIYVSNVNLNPRKKDNNGFISTLGQDGKLELKWATGMSAPKGMGLYKDVLYTADIDAIVEIDANTGNIIKRHTVEGALMLNDVVVDQNDGTVYFSAMDTNKIYTLKDGKIELWKENMNKPNGLYVEGEHLLVASLGEGTLKAYNIKTKQLTSNPIRGLGKADGIAKLSSGNFVVSDWKGEIFLIANDKKISIYNTIEENVQAADIASIPGQEVVLIPTFYGNRVKAYLLSY